MTPRFSRRSLPLAALLLAALPVSAQEADTLYFSAIPDDDETRLPIISNSLK